MKMQAMGTARREKRLQPRVDLSLVFAALPAVYVIVRLVAFAGQVGKPPPVYPDTYDYERIAQLPLWSFEFYSSWKPWLLPLLYKILPGSNQTVVPGVQWLISVVSWLVLALVVASFVENRVVKALSLAGVLAFSAVPLITQWDGALLSESVSLSSAALFVAAMLVFTRNPVRRTTILVLAASLAFAAIRDTNAFLLVMLAVPLGIVVALRLNRRAGIALVAGALTISTFAFASYNVRRWQIPLAAVIAQRVLTDPEHTAWFRDHGMPVGSDMRTVIFRSRVPPAKFDETPELAYFRPWFRSQGRRTYARFLITHPGYSIAEPVRNLPNMTAPIGPTPLGVDFYRPPGYRNALPSFARTVLYPNDGWVIVGWMLVALVAVLALWRLRLARLFWLVPTLCLLSTVPHAILVWDGDWVELARHSVLVAILLRLSLLLLVFFVLDELVRSWRENDEPAHARPTARPG